MNKLQKRPPVVTILGHIDHGKSSLLDYIRKTKTTEYEFGGITQHIGAYEITKEYEGETRNITFIDTPGHSAFTSMRENSTKATDIAVLIVAADDGVKEQTKEAYEIIKRSGVPFLVVITKTDKPNSNIEKTKQSLLEKKIYLEGLGGDIPWIATSAKTGEGVEEMLNLILLLADLNDFKSDESEDMSGIVIESDIDPKIGIAATIVIKKGVLNQKEFVVSGSSISPTRIMLDFLGNPIKKATPSKVVRIIGFNTLPSAGETIISFSDKKSAENSIRQTEAKIDVAKPNIDIYLPVIIRTNVTGALDAIKSEIKNIEEGIPIHIIDEGVGYISEGDINKAISIGENVVLASFHTGIDKNAYDLAVRNNIKAENFETIYELVEWIKDIAKQSAPKVVKKEETGKAKIIRLFATNRDKVLCGARVIDGSFSIKQTVDIKRGEDYIGKGKVESIQQNHEDKKTVNSKGSEFALSLQTDIPVQMDDYITSFIKVKK